MQENLVKARLYKIVAGLFFFLGVVMFFIFSAMVIDGNISVIFNKPILILGFFAPFFPAYVFMILSDKKRQAAMKDKQAKQSAQKT